MTELITLVVAATRAEAVHVPPACRLVVTGLGKTAAAVQTTAVLAGLDPRTTRVVNIGTAGALRDGVSGLHLPGTVINHDMNADAVRALGYDPQEEIAVDGGDGTVLASGDVFVTDPVVRASLGGRADLVDMEGYAVAYACQRLGVPVRLVKHVSDNADETALDWPAMVEASAVALGAWLEEYVAR